MKLFPSLNVRTCLVCGHLSFVAEEENGVDFREKFKDIQKANSPESRSIYIYPTTVTACLSDSFIISRLTLFHAGHGSNSRDVGIWYVFLFLVWWGVHLMRSPCST